MRRLNLCVISVLRVFNGWKVHRSAVHLDFLSDPVSPILVTLFIFIGAVLTTEHDVGVLIIIHDDVLLCK